MIWRQEKLELLWVQMCGNAEEEGAATHPVGAFCDLSFWHSFARLPVQRQASGARWAT